MKIGFAEQTLFILTGTNNVVERDTEGIMIKTIKKVVSIYDQYGLFK
jgi:hypothetical protein